MSLEPNTRIGRYEIHSTLGRGGMGMVYLARDTSMDRMVAIKVLAAEIAPDPKSMQRFDKEARAVSTLNHPNILTIYESGQVDATRFIAMEYVAGMTLREYLEGAALPGRPGAPAGARRMKLQDVLKIAIQIAAALDAAHEAKVVHRDIKPENVMIWGRDLLVKVIDFGLAKLIEKPASTQTGTTVQMLTQPGAVIGTVKYMSPEQAAGSNEVDHRTDIWSLGVVLYELITGRLPFEGKDEHRLIVAIQESDPARLATHAQGVPERLEEIVAKTLAKNPDERYQTARDLLTDLRLLSRRLDLNAEIDRMRPPAPNNPGTSSHDRSAPSPVADSGKAPAQAGRSKASQIISGVKRHQLAAGIIGVVVAAAAIGIYFLTHQKSSVLLGQSNYLMRTGMATNACISPDGKLVAYVSSEADKESLMLMNKEDGNARVLVPPVEQHFWGLTFRRDGNYVYYVTREGGKGNGWLYRVAVHDVAPPEKRIYNVDSPVTFSPNGQEMAFIRNNPPDTSDLLIADVDATDAKTKLATTGRAEVFASVPAYSPDGQVIACATQDLNSGYKTVTGIRGDGGRIKFDEKHWGDIFGIAWASDNLLLLTASEPHSNKQIWSLSYPDGQAKQMSQGRDDYSDISLTADSRVLVAVQSRRQSNVYLSSATNGGRIEKLTQGTDEDANDVSWTTDGRILYDSPIKGNLDVWVINPASPQPQPLTSDSSAEFFPSASSKYIVFISNRSGSDHVWRMDVNGSNRIQLLSGDTYEVTPVVTPDSKWVIYQPKGNAAGIWKVPIGGGTPRPVVDARGFLPSVDPRGEKIAYWFWNGEPGTDTRRVSIGIATLPDGTPARPPIDVPPTAVFWLNLQWSKDSKAILYIDNNDGASNIWSQPLDGGKPQPVTRFTTGRISSFAYSQDGTQLAFTQGDTASDIVQMTLIK